MSKITKDTMNLKIIYKNVQSEIEMERGRLKKKRNSQVAKKPNSLARPFFKFKNKIKK